jgi:2-isopropylmalate synthase
MNNKVIIFDTTLRDGEQSPGASLNVFEKIEIARQLQRLGVDIIEAGFPVSSPSQFEAVKAISSEVSCVVAGLARAKEQDILSAYKALKDAVKFRIHTFIGTSDIHILGKFSNESYGKSLSEKRNIVFKMTQDAVSLAKTFTNDVEFSTEDAGRTDINYLCEVIEAAIEAGATTVNVPDTTGYTLPEEYGGIFKYIRQNVKNIDKAILSVHCHNDLGLAVANSLSGLINGARQVECTVNGIGERAGNASLEEIVMAIKVRKDLLDFYTDIKTEEIFNTSRMVSSFTGIIVQPNKAIVGDNAFAHEAGIHQDGMLKDRNTYEIMSPQSVGFPKTKIILGKHSGKHGLKVRLSEIGYLLSETELNDVYEKFTALADKKKEIFDDDLRFIMGDSFANINSNHYELEYIHVSMGTNHLPTSTVKIKKGDKIYQESATGDGAVDACFKAIERALNLKLNLESYQVRSITSGRQALGEVIVRIREDEKYFSGRGISTDVIEASAKAYINVTNVYQNYLKDKEDDLMDHSSLSDISQAI